MLQLRIVGTPEAAAAASELLEAEPGATLVTRSGDGRTGVVEALVAREALSRVLEEAARRGIPRDGGITVQHPELVLSDPAVRAGRAVSGDADDAVVWEELVATTGEDSELTPVFLAFLVIACLLAAIGVVTDSAVTIVGAMVVCPDFGPLAAIAVGAVGRHRALARRGALALLAGYLLAIGITVLAALSARAVGLFDPGSLRDLGAVSFVYQVGPASAVVAVLAGLAGMLALTSQKSGALIGVFISVTTIPAAGSAAVAAVVGDWGLAGLSLLQLLVNLAGVVVAGILALWLRRDHVHHVLGRGRSRILAP